MSGMKRYYQALMDADQEIIDSVFYKNPELRERLKEKLQMALGGNKKGSKGSSKGGKSGGGKKKEKDNSSKRYVGSIWENEGKDGSTYLSMSVDNLDPDSEYHKGNLIWFDKETGQYYKVKSMSVYGADKGPQNLTNKLVLDLDNEYHVEELESE